MSACAISHEIGAHLAREAALEAEAEELERLRDALCALPGFTGEFAMNDEDNAKAWELARAGDAEGFMSICVASLTKQADDAIESKALWCHCDEIEAARRLIGIYGGRA